MSTDYYILCRVEIVGKEKQVFVKKHYGRVETQSTHGCFPFFLSCVLVQYFVKHNQRVASRNI